MLKLLRLCASVLLVLASAPAGAATKEVGPIVSNVVATLVDQALIPFDASVAFAFRLTLGGNHKLDNPSGLVAGALYMLEVRQDATGSRLLDYGTSYRFPAAAPPALTTTANALDVLLFYSDGTYLNFFELQKNMETVVGAPSGLTATTDQTGQITLNWVDNSLDEDGFEILLDNGLGGFDIVATVGAGVTTYVNAQAAGSYTYIVKATRGAAHSAASNTATGTSL